MCVCRADILIQYPCLTCKGPRQLDRMRWPIELALEGMPGHRNTLLERKNLGLSRTGLFPSLNCMNQVSYFSSFEG